MCILSGGVRGDDHCIYCKACWFTTVNKMPTFYALSYRRRLTSSTSQPETLHFLLVPKRVQCQHSDTTTAKTRLLRPVFMTWLQKRTSSLFKEAKLPLPYCMATWSTEFCFIWAPNWQFKKMRFVGGEETSWLGCMLSVCVREKADRAQPGTFDFPRESDTSAGRVWAMELLCQQLPIPSPQHILTEWNIPSGTSVTRWPRQQDKYGWCKWSSCIRKVA